MEPRKRRLVIVLLSGLGAAVLVAAWNHPDVRVEVERAIAAIEGGS